MTKIWMKLVFIFLIILLAITGIFLLLFPEFSKKADFTQKEINGAEYLSPLGSIYKGVIDIKSELNAYILGDAEALNRIKEISVVTDEAIAVLEEVNLRNSGTIDNTTGSLTRIQKSWDRLKSTLATSPSNAIHASNRVLDDVGNMLYQIGDSSNLSLDQRLDSHYIALTLISSLPEFMENVSKLQDISASISSKYAKTREQHNEMNAIVNGVRSRLAEIERTLGPGGTAYKAFDEEGSEVKLAEIPPLVSGLKQSTGDYVKNINNKLIRPQVLLGVNGISLLDQSKLTLAAAFKLYDNGTDKLESILRVRSTEVLNQKTIILGAIFFALIIIFLVVYFIFQGITSQVKAISESLEEIRAGNYQARAEVLSGDELGDTAQSLNIMLEEIISLVQSREDRDRIQRSIRKLLEEVADVAQGDLTIEAEVTADMTGAIADSFNYMINELRRVIGQVQYTTLQVSSSANEVQATMENLMEGSETQSAQIIDTSAAIDEMAISIKQVSENATMSATVAEEALNNSRKGSQAVVKTINAMNGIREQVQETAKRIKRLGESSQEIGEIIQLIGDIADRTSILALNASIQAAMAGEAGRGFAVVAEEIERLAERSTEATKRISTLIKTIQTETVEAVAAMEDTTAEVVNGSNLANEAGKALVEIETVSNQLAELMQSISMAAKQQARGSETVANSMAEISQITQSTSSGTREVYDSVANLSEATERLRASVSTFQLPEDMTSEFEKEEEKYNAKGEEEAQMDGEESEGFTAPEEEAQEEYKEDFDDLAELEEELIKAGINTEDEIVWDK